MASEEVPHLGGSVFLKKFQVLSFVVYECASARGAQKRPPEIFGFRFDTPWPVKRYPTSEAGVFLIFWWSPLLCMNMLAQGGLERGIFLHPVVIPLLFSLRRLMM